MSVTKPAPHLGLHKRVVAALSDVPSSVVRVENVMAVILKESYGNANFCKCDSLYRQNLHSLHRNTGIDENLFLERIKIRQGQFKGSIPKFRFETNWWQSYAGYFRRHGWDEVTSAKFCCSYGIGQKSGYFLTARLPWSEREAYLDWFNANEKAQIVQLFHDLQTALNKSKGDWQLAYTRYNSGLGARHVSDYGRIVDGYFNFLWSAYGGREQCAKK